MARRRDEDSVCRFDILCGIATCTRFGTWRSPNFAESWTGRIVTAEYILTEVANHLSSSRFGRQKFGELLTSIESDQSTEVVAASRGLWLRGVALYLQRADKEWSLTDCISFVIMKERGLGEALTADHHFEQAGFRKLLNL